MMRPQKFTFVVLIGLAMACFLSRAGGQTAATKSQPASITYTVVKEWPLGKVIVVPASSRRDKAGLIALLQQIAGADSSIRQIRVWDDQKAATLRENSGSLSKRDEDFVSQHFVGLYERHHVTGKETLLYYGSGGANDEGTDIDITAGSESNRSDVKIDSTTSGPVVIDASKFPQTSSSTPASYIGRDTNLYGQPMEVVIRSELATDDGLVAVARRLARDNAKFPLVLMPVQIYVENGSRHEVAEYFHTQRTHDLRINGSDGFVTKIVKFPQAKASVTSEQKATSGGGMERGSAVGITMANYKRLKSGMTYSEVVKILGMEGVEMSSSDIAGIHTVVYMWRGEGIGNMNAMFQNGRMLSKGQFGLK